MAHLAIIPARGGSKRIPRKNIRRFAGRPIISYPIEAARNSGLFDEVMVSTDDAEIAEVSKHCGAVVPFMRSQKSSDDFATTLDVIKEVVLAYEAASKKFDFATVIYPTAPFVTPELLNKAFDQLTAEKRDCVFPIVRYSHPIQRAFRMSNGVILLNHPGSVNARSQDLEANFYDAGMFYCFDIRRLLNSSSLWTANSSGIEISELECQDIDTEPDWQLAELKYRFLHEK